MLHKTEYYSMVDVRETFSHSRSALMTYTYGEQLDEPVIVYIFNDQILIEEYKLSETVPYTRNQKNNDFSKGE